MRIAVIILAGLVASGQTNVARDWPQWRGPARDGIVPAGAAPDAWPAALKPAWRVEIGEGYSSPVVAAGRIFTHSRRDPAEIVTALNLADGRIVWQKTYQAPYAKNSYATDMAKGPNATPLVAGGRLFTLGATGRLVAWDAATGKELWAQDYSAGVDFSKLFCGTAASPLLVNGHLVVQVGSDIHGGRVLALDPATGATRWTWKGPGPGYASPGVIETGGTRQIVTMTNGSVVGIDAATGAELWTSPFPDQWHENIVTPIWTGSALVVSSKSQGTQALTIARDGKAWKATPLWKNPTATMYMSSPVVGDGVLYGMSNRRSGQYVALDVTTGALKWATEGREGQHASVLLTPKHVVFLSNTGVMSVARRGAAAFEAEKKYDNLAGAGETWAVPVFAGRDVIVRDAGGVSRFSAAGQQ
jgi:outer membrane protein assembly factor BamB